MKLKLNDIIACKLLFFSISFFVGLWTVRIPNIKDQIETTYTGMSYLFVIFSIGSIITMILAPKIIQKYPPKNISLAAGCCISFSWILIPFVSSFIEIAIVSLIFGSAYGIFEVVLNLQATSLEKKYKKPMMSGFHAFWSIGLLGGSLLTSLFLEFKISFLINSIAFIVFIFPIILFSSTTLENNNTNSQSFLGVFFRWPLILILLVVLSLTAVFLEGGTDSWGALYMRDYLMADGFNVGLAAIAFNSFMVIGRLVGDGLKTKFGIIKFLFISILLSLFGSIIVLFSNSIFISILGFMIAGFGVSSIVPICYTFASSIKNIDPTVSVTVITIAIYGVFMIAPPILGYTANIIGIQYVYLPVVILFFVSTLMFLLNKKILDN